MVKPPALPEEVKREFMLESQEKGAKQLPRFFFLQQKHIKRHKMANRRAPFRTPTLFFSYLRRTVQHLMINTRGGKNKTDHRTHSHNVKSPGLSL